MTAAWIVLGWVLLVLLIVLAAAWATQSEPVPPPHDSELPTTVPTDPDHPPDTEPGAVVWAQPPWVNTVPTGSVPLDQADDGREARR